MVLAVGPNNMVYVHKISEIKLMSRLLGCQVKTSICLIQFSLICSLMQYNILCMFNDMLKVVFEAGLLLSIVVLFYLLALYVRFLSKEGFLSWENFLNLRDYSVFL